MSFTQFANMKMLESPGGGGTTCPQGYYFVNGKCIIGRGAPDRVYARSINLPEYSEPTYSPQGTEFDYNYHPDHRNIVQTAVNMSSAFPSGGFTPKQLANASPTPPPSFQQYMAMKGMAPNGMRQFESPGEGIRPPFPQAYSGESRGFYRDEMNRRMDDYIDSLFAQ